MRIAPDFTLLHYVSSSFSLLLPAVIAHLCCGLRNSGAMTDPVWQAHLNAAVTAVNSDQEACPSNASKIQKFAILPRNFSVQGGELTPTFKLKRQFVEQEYEAVVDGLY